MRPNILLIANKSKQQCIPVQHQETSMDEQESPSNNQQQRNKPKEKKFKEPKIKWKKSKARDLLYKDLVDGLIPRQAVDEHRRSTMKLEDIFQMHPEYKLYDRKKFSGRLSNLRQVYDECMFRAEIDQEAFEKYRENHQPSLFSHKGYPEWQGSEAQRLLKLDIEAGKHTQMSKTDLHESKIEYYENYPLDAFRDKIYQELRTAKYLHTCRERGVLHVAS
jgi:hypothetical protein